MVRREFELESEQRTDPSLSRLSSPSRCARKTDPRGLRGRQHAYALPVAEPHEDDTDDRRGQPG